MKSFLNKFGISSSNGKNPFLFFFHFFPLIKKIHFWEKKRYRGGPPLKRRSVMRYSQVVVDVQLEAIELLQSEAKSEVILIGKYSKVKDLRTQVAKIMNKEEEEIVLFSKGYIGHTKLDDLDETISLAFYTPPRQVIAKLKTEEEKTDSDSDEQTSYPSSFTSSTSKYSSDYSSSKHSSYYSSYNSSFYSSSYTAGVCGLKNLGNTCFMNSALQCVMHSPLKDYFLKGEYKRDINSDNPLGTGGKLVKAFGELCNELWSGKNSSLAPYDFKSCIEKIAPRFIGYQQQDAAELLAYLLDGIHEDVNTVKRKPLVPKRECSGLNLKEAAELSWEDYKKRNNSVIVEEWMGQLKSTLLCPNKECNNVSVIFDPFLTLALPLEDTSIKPLSLTFWPLTGPPSKLHLSVPLFGSAKDIFKEISVKTGVKVENLFMLEIYKNKYYKMFKEDAVASIQKGDELAAYELEETDIPLCEQQIVCFVNAATCPSSKGMFSKESFKDATTEIFSSQPLLFRVRKEKTTYSMLEKMVCERLKHLFAQEENFENTPKCKYFSLYGKSLLSPHYDSHFPLELSFVNIILWELSFYKKVTKEDSDAFKQTKKEDSKREEKKRGEEGVKIEDCFQLFSKPEELAESEAWYCPKCKKHQQATKQLSLWKTPPVLVLHLKRFSAFGSQRDKLSHMVHFPLEGLDLSHFVPHLQSGNEKPVYDLFAVSNHFGGLGGGHYTAYALVGDQWYEFDDNTTSKCKPEEVVTKSGYVLFYKRRPSSSQMGKVTEKEMDLTDETQTNASNNNTNGDENANNEKMDVDVKEEDSDN